MHFRMQNIRTDTLLLPLAVNTEAADRRSHVWLQNISELSTMTVTWWTKSYRKSDKGLVEEADTRIGVRYAFDTSYGVRYANLSNRVIDAQFQAIHEFAKNSCVIVGRSSDYILKDSSDVMNVFIYAPKEDEIASVMKKSGLNQHKAEEEWENVEKSQHARHEYITGKKRGDRHTRDILLNSSLLGWEATAQFIEELVERKFNLTENLEKEA